MSAVVIAGEPSERSDGVDQETAMISALGQPLIDYVLDALSDCWEISEVLVTVTGSTPLTEAHVRSRGYRSISTPGGGFEADLHYVMRLLSTPYVLAVAANLPLLRSKSIDEAIAAFYQSKKSAMLVGVPIDDVQEAIVGRNSVMDMDGVKAIPCGVWIMDRNLALSRLCCDEAHLVTDLEDFAVGVCTLGQLRMAEGFLKARGWKKRSPSDGS